MPSIRLVDASARSDRLANAASVALPRADILIKAPANLMAALRRAYAGRKATPDAVDLVHLPPDATVRGDNFYLRVDGHLVVEQMPPASRAEPAPQLPLPDQMDIGEPTVLIARYGEGTWGHWIGELIPKAALVEQQYPGRFRYAMPARIVARNPQDVVSVRVSEAFAAYGIAADRLIGLRGNTEYSFRSLSAVSPVWTDQTLHPAALAAMRALETPPGHAPRRAALLRTDTRRGIMNMHEIGPILARAGFSMVPIGTLPFVDQVSVFRSAAMIVSTLGSTLSGLIYSPAGVGVVAAAPDRFLDTFFYAMIQERQGRYAEVHGPSVSASARLDRDNSFVVPPDDLTAALDSLEADKTALPSREALIAIYDDAARVGANIDLDSALMMRRVAGIMALEKALAIQLTTREIDACLTTAAVVDLALGKVRSVLDNS